MSSTIDYLSNQATVAEIAEHLLRCDADFVPPLTSRVEINNYAQKIASNAIRFEAWSAGTLVGLVAAYCNNTEHNTAYITNVSVLSEWTGLGIATHLLSDCINHTKALSMSKICLEVSAHNRPAIRLYEKSGFTADGVGGMSLYFEKQEQHEPQARL